jgi:hypothetical protein
MKPIQSATQICTYLGVPDHWHKHYALCLENWHASNHNSNHIFYTQFVFRGLVANKILQTIGGNGKQLQQFLGNCTSNSVYSQLFDEWQLFKEMPETNKSKISETNKHLLAQGFIGWALQMANEDALQTFIQRFFIEPNDHLLPKTFTPKNEWQQLNLLVRQQYQTVPKLLHTTDASSLHYFSLMINEQIITTAQSISFKYAKKKCITKAMQYVTKEASNGLQQNITHQAIEAERQNQQQQQTQAYHLQKQEKLVEKAILKKLEKVKRITAKEALAKQKDKARRLAKKDVKEKVNRKGKDTIYRAYSPEEIAAMSVSKKRNLQDKGILPQGV